MTKPLLTYYVVQTREEMEWVLARLPKQRKPFSAPETHRCLDCATVIPSRKWYCEAHRGERLRAAKRRAQVAYARTERGKAKHKVDTRKYRAKMSIDTVRG